MKFGAVTECTRLELVSLLPIPVAHDDDNMNKPQTPVLLHTKAHLSDGGAVNKRVDLYSTARSNNHA